MASKTMASKTIKSVRWCGGVRLCSCSGRSTRQYATMVMMTLGSSVLDVVVVLVVAAFVLGSTTMKLTQVEVEVEAPVVGQ